MMRMIFLVAILSIATSVAEAQEGFVAEKSAHGVTDTVDRLEAVLDEKGVTVFARVDHADGAREAGMELRPTELLIFGNPKLGTPLMQSNQRIGLDLPIHVLAWEDESGQTWIGYTDPAVLMKRHGIAGRDEIFGTMAGAIASFTAAAAAP